MIAITTTQINRWFVLEIKRNFLQRIFLNNKKYILSFGRLDDGLQLETTQTVSIYETEIELRGKILSLTGDSEYYDTSEKNINK